LSWIYGVISSEGDFGLGTSNCQRGMRYLYVGTIGKDVDRTSVRLHDGERNDSTRSDDELSFDDSSVCRSNAVETLIPKFRVRYTRLTLSIQRAKELSRC
jgi:hypothetical protein